jgi:hypothetical protein
VEEKFFWEARGTTNQGLVIVFGKLALKKEVQYRGQEFNPGFKGEIKSILGRKTG